MIWSRESSGQEIVYDTEALTVTTIPASHLGLPETVRPMTEAEHVGMAAYAFDGVRGENRATLCDPTALAARIAELNTYQADPDVVAAAEQANATPLTAQQQNRFNKATIRQQRRLKNLVVALARLVDPALLDDISDTTGA
jgi:hypothetical protein